MPQAWCVCTGCTACSPGSRSHLYDKSTSPGRQRCQPCQAVTDRQRNARAPSSARGYGAEHQALRRQLVEQFRPGQPCARCGKPIWRAEDADLGHADGQQGYRGLEHAVCNRGASRRGKRTQ